MTTARAERRLAAILAADVVGYSRLIERDERGTLARLKALPQGAGRAAPRRAPRPDRQAHGRRRALSSSRASSTRSPARSRSSAAWRSARQRCAEAERLRFRIGINLGDVVREEDGDLYGDGVNVAARLEQVGRARRDRGLGHRLRPPPGQARLRLRAPRRAAAQEHRAAGAGLPGRARRRRPPPRRRRRSLARQAGHRRPAVRQHERRSRSRPTSATASPRTSSPSCRASASCW